MKAISVALAAVRSRVGRIEANLERTAHWANKARRLGADLVCFPELNITGYAATPSLPLAAIPIPGKITRFLQTVSEREGIALVAGAAEKAADGRIYATQMAIRPERSPSFYRKIHIAPMERPLISAGSAATVFDWHGFRLGIQLCYDAHFPELTTRMALNGIDGLLIPHASPRGTPEEKLDSWHRHLPARAFDNGIYVAACNPAGSNGEGMAFPGVTVAYGPDGRRLDARCHAEEGLAVVTFHRDVLDRWRRHPIAYFLPNRRPDSY
jgi:N-carbamoylputrescine amidase